MPLWIRLLGFIFTESTEHTIEKCSRQYDFTQHPVPRSQPQNHNAHELGISLVSLLSAHQYCLTIPLPYNADCDTNYDGVLNIKYDYLLPEKPRCSEQQFPFYSIDSIPETCLCKRTIIEFVHERFCN
jgi:hypothetical protein